MCFSENISSFFFYFVNQTKSFSLSRFDATEGENRTVLFLLFTSADKIEVISFVFNHHAGINVLFFLLTVLLFTFFSR